MKKYIGLLVISLILLIVTANFIFSNKPRQNVPVWDVRSVDTTKYSRDVAGQMLTEKGFDELIESQVAQVASVGATHIALGTPYDTQFKPVLKKWVDASRKKNLKVWFRGNFSGWEEWFGYQRIGREEHKELLRKFILENPDLFDDGDIFTSCPECENGGPGDPRLNGDVWGHRQFLIEEYQISQESFGKIGKKVTSGYYSMNLDVANLVMDQKTTKALGNIVAIDHYIKTPNQLISDVRAIAERTGGKVVLGEFGAPIPDIHGDMTEFEQANWIDQAFSELIKIEDVIAVNYWTGVGGSTAIFRDNGEEKKAVPIIRKYFLMKKTVAN